MASSHTGITSGVGGIKGKAMTRNQAMYKWSGGCCWQHTCQECKNLICVEAGKRKVYKCLAYGHTGSAATDWKASYMACRRFNQPVPERPLIETGEQPQNSEEELPGQISIFDIDGIVPEGIGEENE